jgi:hypothetical protein
MGLLIAVAVFATLAPGVALAQYPLPQDLGPANPEGVTSFCYYAGTLYSVGARLCVPGVSQNSYTLVCQSQDEDKNASKTGHAVWRFDVGPPAPTCGFPAERR